MSSEFKFMPDNEFAKIAAEEAKRQRRLANATKTRCKCGNIAQHNFKQCGRCARETEETEQQIIAEQLYLERKEELRANELRETAAMDLEERIVRIEQILRKVGLL